MSQIKVLPFKRKLRTCPKCGGKTKRFYCLGEYGDCADYFATATRGKEHHNVNCQECSYQFYEAVRP